MAVAGSLTYDTKLNTRGYKKGLNSIKGDTQSAFSQIKNIVSALGIDKVINSMFSTLTSSIDSAMNRIDTMNQFTKVITVMTGSAEDTQKALEDVKNTVKGTAYGLDVAAKSTQKFVTSGMKLDKATEQIKTWADAVAFYGDGTNETFENVTDALSKMVSKGKVEMDQLNRLTDAGIPAVQIYADMVGRSTAEVQDDLSNGVISAEEFMNGLQTAFNEGTPKFASITNAAKDAGTSWSATFDNAKAAVTRGVQGIIESIDKMLEDNDLPTMEEMISNFASKAEEWLNKVSDAIEKIDFDELKDTIKKLIPVVIALTGAWASYQAIMKAFSIAKVISGFAKTVGLVISLAKEVKNLKDAMILLELVTKTNPMVLLVSAILALVAAFIYLWNTSEKFRQFWIDLGNTIMNFVNNVVTFFTETVPTTINNFIELVINTFENLPYYIGYFIGLVIGHIVKFGLRLIEFATKDVPEFIGKVVEWFKGLPSKIWTWLLDTISKIGTWISNMATTCKEKIPELISDIVKWFQDLPSKMLDIGKNIIDGIWNGIKSAKENFEKNVKKFFKGIVDGVKDALGIHSPSRVFAKEVGQWIPKGVAIGIDDNTNSIMKSLNAMNNEMVSKMKNAVALETGNINAKAKISSSVANNSVIQINANFDGSVEMDKNKVGRIITPVVSKTLKVGGIR